MAEYNPFSKDQEEKKKEQNWFMKTATMAAAFGGTAFGVYGLWKISGPSRRLLEKAVDDRMNNVIANEISKSSDHFKEETTNFIESRKQALSFSEKAFTIDPSTAWDLVQTDTNVTSTVSRLEANIINHLEAEATIASPSARLIRRGQTKIDPQTFIALEKGTVGYEKTVSLTGLEAEELALLRYRVIQEYLQKYGESAAISIENPAKLEDLANMSDFFSGTEYFQSGPIKDGFGKKSITRISTIHEAYMSDRNYSDIYLRQLKQLNSRVNSRKHTIANTKVKDLIKVQTGNYRQMLYGNIASSAFDPKDFKINPVVENIVEFDINNPEIVLKKSLTSQGNLAWDPGSKWKKLQQTEYTGLIKNIAESLKDRQQEGRIASYSIDLFDYGTSRNPDKRLRVTMVHPKDIKAYSIEIPISIDGRLPGATPGLSQKMERYHKVGNAYTWIGSNREAINTTEKNLIEFRMMLDGSLLTGAGNAFADDPRGFVKRVTQSINNNIKETAGAKGALTDLVQAMSIDDPVLKDLVFSDRPRHASSVAAAHNFVVSARNAKQLATIKRGGGDAVIISLDLETLDNTSATPEKALLSQNAQIVKAGIVVQDGNKVHQVIELANETGYNHFKAMDDTLQGQGFNNNLRTWLRKGVLPDASIGNEVERYRALLDQEKRANPEGWSNAKNRQEFVKELSAKIRAIKAQYEKEGKKVFIATKNGINFDLRAFLMDDPHMYEELLKDSIDVQALHKFRNVGLGESNALNIEAVVKAMMGRLGIPEAEYTWQHGKRRGLKGEIIPKRVLDAIRKKARSSRNTALLDWTENAYKTFHGHKLLLRLHASPKVDAALTSALLGEIITDYMAGTNDYLNAADHVGRLLDKVTKGPMTPGSLLELYRSFNDKAIDGFSLNASSQNMVSKLIASYIDLNDLNVIMSPTSQTARRLIASPFNMTISKNFLKSRGGESSRTNISRQYLGRFTSSQAVEDGASYMLNNVLRVDDNAAHFSNAIRGNFLYALDLSTRDSTISLTKQYMNMFSRRMEMSVPTDARLGDVLSNHKIAEFTKAVFKKAQDIAGTEKVNMIHIEQAEAFVREHPPTELKNWNIKLSEEIISASKFGGEQKFPQRALYGRITGVTVERDTVDLGRTSPQRLLAKVEYFESGYEAFKGAQAQMIGSHAVISEAIAAGTFGKHDIHGFAGAEFLKKGDVGAFKHIMLNTVLSHLASQVDDPNTPYSVRETSKNLIEEIKRTLNATSDLKYNKFIFKDNSIAGSPISEQVRHYGNKELRIKQLISWYKQAGLVWSKKDIKNLGNDVSILRQYEESFKQASKMSINEMKTKFGYLQDSTDAQIASVKDDLDAITSLFKVEHGGVKALGFANYGGGKVLGLMSLNDSFAIYNVDPTTSRNRTSMFRQDYLFGVMGTLQGQNESTIQFLTKHTFAKRDAKFKSALATKTAFSNALFAKTLARDKLLNIDQINSLVDIEQRVKDRRAQVKTGQTSNWEQLSSEELAQAKKDILTLSEKEASIKGPDAIKNLHEEAEAISEILGKRGKTYVFERIARKNIYSQSSISKIQEIALKNKGVLQFALPKVGRSDALTIDLDHYVETAFKFGIGVDISPYEVKKYKDKLVNTIKAHQANASKDSPIRIRSDGKLELGAAIFDWDPYPMNSFNPIEGGGIASHETQVKIQAMEALNKYQRLVTASDQKGMQNTGPIDAVRDEFVRKYLTYMFVGNPADKMSTFWQSGQFAVESVRLIHKDINTVHKNILQLESGTGKSKKYMPTINAIKQARLDTVLIHEKAFRSFRYVDEKTGERVSAAKIIEQNLGAEIDTSEYFEGRKALPGGIFMRHPIPQAGYDGLRTGKYLIVPTKLANTLGMDANSAYANPIYTAAQKADFDGDQMFFHLKEIATLKQFNKVKEDDNRTFDQIMKLPEIQEELRSSAIEFNEDGTLTKKVKIGAINAIMAHKGEKTVVSTLNPITGNNEFKTVKTSMLDYGDVVKHVVGLVEESAKRGGRATTAQLQAAGEATANTLISKNLIPLTTNLLKTRAFELLGSDVGNVKNATAVMSFLGNIKHGVAGMAQGVIEMSKHADKAASMAATLNWLQDPTKEAPEAKQYYMETKRKQLGSAFNEQLEEDSWNFFSGKLRDFSIIRKNNPDFRVYENQLLDGVMGRKNATIHDVLSSLVERTFGDMPEIKNRTISENLSDALSTRFGRQIDIAPKLRKMGKYGAIGAAAFLGLSMFTPFGNSKSLNPIDMFTDIGNIDGHRSAISSPLELGRGSALNMVDASFSKEAYIKMNKSGRNDKRNRANIINSMLMNSNIVRTEGFYEFQTKSYNSYSNYTTRVPTIGTNELNRRNEL